MKRFMAELLILGLVSVFAFYIGFIFTVTLLP